MIAYEEALKLLLGAADDIGRLPFSSVPLREAPGRVAASDVTAQDPLPPFDNSAMDGFAVASASAAGASVRSPVRLPVVASLSAGDAPAADLPAEGAVEIMTGAPLPPGRDAVVKVEDARRDGRFIELTAPVAPGAFVRRAGDDARAGETVVAAGTWLDARHVLALAALGVSRVPARWKAKVALISTGRELAGLDAPLAPGQVRDATGPFLGAALERFGAELRPYGTVGDDAADFKRKMDAVLADENDVVLTTGAVSMGRHDFVAEAVAELGADLIFHKAAVRPGKPVLAARFGHGPLFLGLPGNPISTVVGLRFFLAPVLRRLLGQADERYLEARLDAPVSKPEGLRCFYKAKVAAGEGGLKVRVLPGQASFQIRPLLDADAWAVLPENAKDLPAATPVKVAPLWPNEPRWTEEPAPSSSAAREACC